MMLDFVRVTPAGKRTRYAHFNFVGPFRGHEKGGKTVQTFIKGPSAMSSHVGGSTSAFDQLAAYAAQIKEHSA